MFTKEECKKINGGELKLTPELIKDKIYDTFTDGIDPYAKRYILALSESYASYGPNGLRMQIGYVISNLKPKSEEEKILCKQLGQIMDEKTVETEFENIEGELDEMEYSRIYEALEEYTAKRDISLKSYKRFAEVYDYPLDKVLVSNPWVKDVCPDDLLQAIEEAKTRIKITF